jgi:iron complex transport system permease protein
MSNDALNYELSRSEFARQLVLKFFTAQRLLAFLLIVMALCAALYGAADIDIAALFSSSLFSDNANIDQQVFFQIRLPRIILAMMVGGLLAIAGCALQAVFRNPMAEPGLIGISSGAGLAVAICVVFVSQLSAFASVYLLSSAAFIGAIISAFIVFAIAQRSQGGVLALLLAGIAINALCFAMIGVLSYIADDQQLRTISLWGMGNLGAALWPQVIGCASFAVPAMFILFRYARQLDIYQLGEQDAASLGVNPQQLKQRIIFLTALAVGAAVAVSGIITFVGLVVPHILRFIVGSTHRLLMPATALAGALLLLLADTLARTLIAPAELPVGLLTSLMGAPYFIFLLLRNKTF